MPVIIPADRFGDWLDARTPLARVRELLVPYASEEMESFRVSPAVNNARNEGPELVRPLPQVGVNTPDRARTADQGADRHDGVGSHDASEEG